MRKTQNKIDMLCILGSTAVGKTHLAAALAKILGSEIISADSRQVYRDMDIGTGKDLDEYCINGEKIPYHLINIVDAGYEFNVFEYQQAFLKAYQEIKNRKALPILCGGTGLYINAVLSGYKLVKVPEDNKLRDELRDKTDTELIVRLSGLRPLHNTTDTMNRNRLIRAIEIAEHSGKPEIDEFPCIETRTYGLRLERNDLKKRIAARLKTRLKNGMIEEVERLLKKLTPEQLEFYGLEYRFVTKYVRGRLNRNDMFQKLNSAIYQFAKRQEKWFRRMERNGIKIIWLEAKHPVGRLVKYITHGLK
ncbi:MAG: tRNA (adenosine(37)-N6)-dimethylallyltransferase MiaA [Candidatus Aureabacteria bacterium]|nr:tRNA (adenosine(37)-N6)-dimethylallyltransferase MiaA [Candidatus Auribacterota bacterium]